MVSMRPAQNTAGRAAHVVYGFGSGEDVQVAVGEAEAVFEFDGGEEGAGFVEVGVVRPGSFWIEALIPTITSPPPITQPVRSGAVPRQPHEQSTIMAVIRRPVLVPRHITVQPPQIGSHVVPVYLLHRRTVRF